MEKVFLAVGFTNVMVIFVGGLVLSHRVAGPLFKIQKHMNDVAEGFTHGHVNFRRNDYFGELADAYNRVLDMNTRKTKAVKTHPKKQAS